jgi:parallel beta-helix repeat protein
VWDKKPMNRFFHEAHTLRQHSKKRKHKEAKLPKNERRKEKRMKGEIGKIGMMIALLLIGVLMYAVKIQPVKTSGTIYIRADGSIDPPTAPISTADNVTYMLTGSIYDSIVIERDNIVVDGAGYALQGAGGGNGIDLTGRANVTIKSMEIKAFYIGIHLQYSSSNVIYGNNITNSARYGVWLNYSSNDLIYHNNFMNNTNRVFNGEISVNVWDGGYPSGGNYWSDYAGADLYHGPYQNETGSDGVGDKPCVIDPNNRDNYPLMKPYPWSQRDIGITYIGEAWNFTSTILPLKTVVGRGFALKISVFVMNYGAYPEVFNATVYANTTAIGSITNVALTSRSSVILNFAWNTTGFTMGNHTISASLTQVAGETYTVDNNYTNGVVQVCVPGDVDGDGIVNMRDLYYIALHYGSRPGDPNYVKNYDVDDNGIINMLDLYYAALQFGQSNP